MNMYRRALVGNGVWGRFTKSLLGEIGTVLNGWLGSGRHVRKCTDKRFPSMESGNGFQRREVILVAGGRDAGVVENVQIAKIALAVNGVWGDRFQGVGFGEVNVVAGGREVESDSHESS